MYELADLTSDDHRMDVFKYYKLLSGSPDFGDNIDDEKYCFGVYGINKDGSPWSMTDTVETGIQFESMTETLVL